MQAKTENRNQFVDIMRGIAMLLVVLGHTMTGCTVDSQKSFSFQHHLVIANAVVHLDQWICNEI